MREPKFTRDGARFIVDHGHFGRFEYDAGIEARSIAALEKALSDHFRDYSGYPTLRAEITDALSIDRDDAALELMKFLSGSVIGPGPKPLEIRQLLSLHKLLDRLVVLTLASIRPLPSKIKIEGSAEARV